MTTKEPPMPTNRLILATASALVGASMLAGCSNAQVASRNLSTEADQFRVQRRIVFIDTVTGEYLFEVKGTCSIQVDKEESQLEVTCRTGKDSYQKHYFGTSPTTTYVAEQIQDSGVDPYHYELIFKPETIVPTVTR